MSTASEDSGVGKCPQCYIYAQGIVTTLGGGQSQLAHFLRLPLFSINKLENRLTTDIPTE
jgi:hypothetical protein